MSERNASSSSYELRAQGPSKVESQAIRRLRARAARSINKPGQRRWPRRFVLFGPRVVPLEVFLLSEARKHRSFQKEVSRLTADLQKALLGIRRRQQSLEAAHEYIVLLKERLSAFRNSYPTIYGDYPPMNQAFFTAPNNKAEGSND